jgi:hypothetical protein
VNGTADEGRTPRNAGIQLATNDAATNLRVPVVVYAGPLPLARLWQRAHTRSRPVVRWR